MKITEDNGDIYEGDFIDGQMTGKGKLTWSNGDIYEGDFIDGQMTGKGKFTWSNGDICEGDFIDGQMTGKGKFTWSDGDIYEGDFIDGQMTAGKFTYTNGDMHEGDRLDGKCHGKGKYTYTNGDIYEGDFIDGQMTGKGKLTFEGCMYEGNFANGGYHGKGVLSLSGGESFEVEHNLGELVSKREVSNHIDPVADAFSLLTESNNREWNIGDNLTTVDLNQTMESDYEKEMPMADISFIEQLLSEGPIINDDQNMLGEYVAFIHNNLDRVQKGSNFGSAILAASYLQGMEAHAGNYDKLNMLSAEANNRMFAHFLYLKEIHSLQVREEAVKYNLNALLVNMACEIVETFSGNAESELVELGIKGVEYISSNILE